MNKYVKWSALGAGALVFFGAAYVGFALALGGSLGELLGKHEPQAQTAAGHEEHAPVAPVAHETPEHAPASDAVHTASTSLLDVFQIESPYTGAELEQLAGELKTKNKELERRMEQLLERERRNEQRAELLEERQGELQKMRADIERREHEIEQRQAELDRDEAAKSERDQQSWIKLAKLFVEGDAAEQGKKLAGYSPEDAARILDQLKPARAKALLDNVGADKWKDYAEAYRKLVEPSKE